MALTKTPSELTAADLTITTAAQPNITSVGTLTGLTVTKASSGATPTAGTVVTIEDDDNTELSLLGGSSSVLAINFGHSGDADDGIITYNTTSGSEAMGFTVNASNRMTIDKDGKVGIGVSSPIAKLSLPAQASGDNGIARFAIESAVDANDFMISQYEDGSGTYTLIGQNIALNSSGNDNILDGGHRTAGIRLDARGSGSIQFLTGGTNANAEAARVTSAGFVGINDDDPPRRLSITGEDGAYSAQTSGNSRTHLLLENNAANLLEFLNPAGSAAGIMWSNQTAQNRAGVIFDSDILFFSQGGYDRACIRSDGAFQTSDTNALVDFDSGGNRVRDASLWGYTLRCEGTSGNPHGHLVTYNAASPDSGASYPFYFTDSTAARFYVTSAGNIWTSDHGTITSDETLKENIVDATPKLADIMKLKVRNFNWKKSYKPNTPEKMLGFIAQEVEEVFPSLIKESDIAPRTSAKDDENHVSNMKKSLVAGALIPVLVKAMQEQQALIETLQTKVKALEEA